MKITVIHPSRSRPAQALATAKKWLSSAKDRRNVEYIPVIDNDDNGREIYLRTFLREGLTVMIANTNTAVSAINLAAKKATGDLFVVISDDFDCPFHWDGGLRKALAGKEDFVAKTHDGLQPWIITLPIMDRKYYDRFGYIYNPEYKHMFCDTELTAVAYMMGRMIFVPITFPHNHYTTGRTKRDELNIKNDATWQQGEALYNSRKATNFGLKDIVHPYPANKL